MQAHQAEPPYLHQTVLGKVMTMRTRLNNSLCKQKGRS
jgi:hypothetical protein